MTTFKRCYRPHLEIVDAAQNFTNKMLITAMACQHANDAGDYTSTQFFSESIHEVNEAYFALRDLTEIFEAAYIKHKENET